MSAARHRAYGSPTLLAYTAALLDKERDFAVDAHPKLSSTNKAIEFNRQDLQWVFDRKLQRAAFEADPEW